MRWITVGCLVAILAVTALSYLPGLGLYFVADDFSYLELASRVGSPGDVLAYVKGACTRVGWPAVILLFWIGRSLSGLQLEAYRLLALGIHLLNAVLVFALVRRVGTRGPLPPLAAALVLALHPRQHEAVLWLSTTTWAVGTAFSLTAALCYVSWRQSRRLGWLAGAVGGVVLAMIGNPSTIVLPVTLAAYDILHKQWRRRDLLLWGGMLTIVLLLGMICGLSSLPTAGERVSYGLALGGVSHLGLFVLYTVWPVPLNLKEIMVATPLVGWSASLALLVLLTVAVLALLVRGNLLTRWGVVWAVLGLLPPSFFSASTSDHYMTLMLAGVALACAGLVEAIPPRWWRWGLVLAALWVITVLPQIAIKVDHWRTAGEITAAVRDETLARYPAPANGSHFFYLGLPDIVNRCVVWTYGIDSAVRMWYNNPTLGAGKDVQFGVRSQPSPGDIILDFSGRW